MDVQRYSKHDRPHKYVAFQLGSAFDPSPSWFNDLVAKGCAKVDDAGVKVLTITGQFRLVSEGDWIVYCNDGTVWEMAPEDFHKLFYKV